MAGKDQIAYRRFAHIPAEGDRTLFDTSLLKAEQRGRKKAS